MQLLFEQSLSFLVYFAVFTVVFAVCEIPFRRARPQPAFNRHSWIDCACGYINILFDIMILSAFVAVVVEQGLKPRFPEHPLAEWIEPLPVAVQLLLALLLFDFFQYWRHRFSHRFLWKFYASHHSALELRWSTHFRFHPVELVLNNLGLAVFLYFLGFGLTEAAWVHLLATVNNMYLHSNIDLRFPRFLRYVITCPNYHKWHHARTKEAIDKNFADIFPVLDLLFGTYYYPQDGKVLPEEYGLRDFGLLDNACKRG